MSIRQAIVPAHLLGRAQSVALVLGYSSIPLGALVGGFVLQQVGVSHVALVYGAIGVLIVLGALFFSCTALGHAERYLPQAGNPQEVKARQAAQEDEALVLSRR